MLRDKPSKVRDEKHKAWVRTLPCVRTGLYGVEFSHCDKWTDKGMATKAGDCYGLPLTRKEHDALHRKGTITYWGGEELAREALSLSEYLYSITGDDDKAVIAINRFRGKLNAIFNS